MLRATGLQPHVGRVCFCARVEFAGREDGDTAPGSRETPRLSAPPAFVAAERSGAAWGAAQDSLAAPRTAVPAQGLRPGRPSGRRCHLRGDPALPGVDRSVRSEEGTSQVFWERPARLGWPGPAAHPTSTPAPEEGITGQ